MVRVTQFVRNLNQSPQLLSLSRPEYKRIRITAYLGIICIFISILYCFADLLNGVYYSSPAYGLLLLNSVGVLFLLSRSHFIAAKISLMITINLVVFYSSLADPFEAGAFLLFIPAGVASFAVLGFQDQSKGYFLTIVTTLLFIISYFGDIELGNTTPSAFYIQLSFIINYIISFTSTILILYFLVELNNESELELITKEKTVSDKNRELTKVNQELDRFVYSVSHDLRSPLASILGIVNLSKHAENKEQLIDYIQLIEGRVKTQDQFIKEIIDYSRNSRTEVEREEIIFSAMVSEVIDSLRFHPGSGTISFSVEDIRNVKLVIDKTRLRIILSNLISNSIKYQDTRKTQRSIIVGIVSTRSGNVIYVKDNGVGIAPEHISRVFEMFYRASEHSSGSGLGLFITREAVDKLGGTISVESQLGVGTTFTVRLPS